MRLPSHTTVYREGDTPLNVFVVDAGLVKSFRELASGKAGIVAFLFPRDVFGLAEHGCYLNTTWTVTESTLYRISYDAVTAALHRDADPQFQFLCKFIQKLREAQRQSIVLRRNDPIGRLAMFLKMLERNLTEPHHGAVIPVRMRRTDIAEYLGLPLDTVNRATRTLKLRNIVAFKGSHVARVKDRAGFESLVAAGLPPLPQFDLTSIRPNFSIENPLDL
jgi:CRP-like cAMP-binding protein